MPMNVSFHLIHGGTESLDHQEQHFAGTELPLPDVTPLTCAYWTGVALKDTAWMGQAVASAEPTRKRTVPDRLHK